MSLDLAQLENVKHRGSKTEARCPACAEVGQDKAGNHLAIFANGAFSCVANAGDKLHRRRVAELAGDESEDWKREAPIPPPVAPYRNGTGSFAAPARKEVAVYPYHDAAGELLFEVVRFEPKEFRQRRKVNGQTTWNLDSVTRVLYRLPEIIKAETVWVTEGEKDADCLASLGHVATCNAGGAGKWQDSYTDSLLGKNVVLCGDNDEPGRKHMDKVADGLKGVTKSIRRVNVPDPHKDITDYLGDKSEHEAGSALNDLLAAPSPLDVVLDARRFNLSAPPAPARPIFSIGKAVIATPGNLCVIAAQAKAGKSALVGGFIASSISSHGDALGITSFNTKGWALIHFDTEQSPCDHHAIVATALRRISADIQPPWLRSYRIADVSMRDRFGLLEHELDRAKRENGGVHSVLLDGVADFINDPNDPEEAFAAVDRLHRLAVTYDTSIVCVLHFNPGSEFNKTRGHLGSQLERKAETNLALEKADGITVVYTKLARHAHIEKDAGARFKWDAEAGMHVSCGTAVDEREASDDFAAKALVEEAFSGRGSLRYSELLAEIMRIKKVKDKTAEKTVSKLVPRYIQKTSFGYSKA